MLIWLEAGLLVPKASSSPVVLDLAFAPDCGFALGHAPERLQLAALSAVSPGDPQISCLGPICGAGNSCDLTRALPPSWVCV